MKIFKNVRICFIIFLLVSFIFKIINMLNKGEEGIIAVIIAVIIGGIIAALATVHYKLTNTKKWAESISLAMVGVFLFFIILSYIIGG